MLRNPFVLLLFKFYAHVEHIQYYSCQRCFTTKKNACLVGSLNSALDFVTFTFLKIIFFVQSSSVCFHVLQKIKELFILTIAHICMYTCFRKVKVNTCRTENNDILSRDIHELFYLTTLVCVLYFGTYLICIYQLRFNIRIMQF